LTAAYVLEWLNFLGRGVHVIAGIAWIGASFYFIWLDNHLKDGELWAVHGGGFYHAQKHFPAPPTLPATLHWFKWEAYTTLLSGLFLMGVVYYAEPRMTLAPLADFSPAAAIATSLAWLAGGWLVYDGLCRSPLGRNDRALSGVLAVLCAISAYALCSLFNGRAAFLHFGAMLGTIMVLNVFFVIIPGQRAMVAAAREGRPVDPIHGMRGKQRSVHNTYFTLPAVFAMISNHYAWIFGAAWNWVWLITISAAGALIRTWFVARHKSTPAPWPLAAAGVLLVVTAYGASPWATPSPALTVTMERVQQIVGERCVPCHSATPRFEGITVAPKGLALERPGEVEKHAARIRDQVAGRAMPPGNITGLTDGEREALLAGLTAGGGPLGDGIKKIDGRR
jgi:uncharacterized membrane protein